MVISPRFYAILVAVMLPAAIFFSAPALADDGGATPSTAPNSQYDDERRDNVFGTMDENIIMGRDPDTGDTIMHVKPKPKPNKDTDRRPIIVEPQIIITPGHKQ